MDARPNLSSTWHTAGFPGTRSVDADAAAARVDDVTGGLVVALADGVGDHAAAARAALVAATAVGYVWTDQNPQMPGRCPAPTVAKRITSNAVHQVQESPESAGRLAASNVPPRHRVSLSPPRRRRCHDG